MKPTNNKQKVPVPQPSSLSHSDTKKPFIIALISFGAIIILVLLLFLSSQFVGKAIWYDDSSLSFGIEQPSSKIYENKPFTLTVKANLGTASTVALAFNLSLGGLNCQAVDNLLDTNDTGAVLSIASCQDGNVLFAYATIDASKALTGEFEIANITVKGAKKGSYTLEFSEYKFVDYSDPSKSIAFLVSKSDLSVVASPTVITEKDCSDYDVSTSNPYNVASSVAVIYSDNSNITYADKCNNNLQLQEYYCSNNQVKSTEYNCSCSAGACKTVTLTYSCTGTVPSSATLCSGDSSGLTVNTTNSLVSVCGTAKCEYTCNTGFTYNSTTKLCKATVATTTYSCTGIAPSSATLCSGDSSGLTANTTNSLVSACTSTAKCEYTCSTGYAYNSTTKSCTSTGTIKLATKTMEIKVTKNSVEVTNLTKSAVHSVTATINANSSLATHLFFVKVVDGSGNDVAVHYESKPSLSSSGSETITFSYTPTSTATGTYTIKAFAWTNWLSLGGKSLGTDYYLEQKYGIN